MHKPVASVLPVPLTAAASTADTLAAIRVQVLRGIALNREPGYHFAGNFLDLSYDHVGTDYTALSVDVLPHCAETDGQLNLSGFAILADLVMAAAVRAGLPPHTRLATVTMNLQFTGAPRSGRLAGRGAMHGFVQGAAGQQGMSAVEIRNAAGLVATGAGTFMMLKPPKGVELHPVPHRRRGENPVPDIGNTLRPDEKKVLAAADAVLAETREHGGSFIQRFWGVQAKHVAGGAPQGDLLRGAPQGDLLRGAQSTVKNGPHIGNRVGHVQGGILLGLAAGNAIAALTPHWALTAISAWYISPGEGRALKIRSKVVHHGRLIAVVHTEVTGKGHDNRSRKVLEVMTTHAYRAE